MCCGSCSDDGILCDESCPRSEEYHLSSFKKLLWDFGIPQSCKKEFVFDIPGKFLRFFEINFCIFFQKELHKFTKSLFLGFSGFTFKCACKNVCDLIDSVHECFALQFLFLRICFLL